MLAYPTKGTYFVDVLHGDWVLNGRRKKKVYWIVNLPYGRLTSDHSLIRFYCLHFQGRSKYSIFKYILDKNKVHHSGFWYDLKWLLSKDILNARLKGIKKAINNPKMVVNFVKAKLK